METIPSFRRSSGTFYPAFRFSSCRVAYTTCVLKSLDEPGVAFTILACRLQGASVSTRIQQQKSWPMSWLPDSSWGNIFCPAFPQRRVTIRVCLLVVLDVLSVFQSPRFSSFFGGNMFFLGAYSYMPHSGFPKVLWERRMGTVISRSGGQNESEELRMIYWV